MVVDFGASGGKCFAGTLEGDVFKMQEIHRFAHEGVSFFAKDSSGAISERTYWDDIYLYDNIIKGLQAYKRNFADTLDSIGIDTWGADGQFVTADGDILGKVYCYRDHRLDNMIAQVKSRIDPRRVYEITGIHFQPFNLTNQLLWFVQNRKHTMQKGATFLPIPALFYYYLGGVKKVDSTWASVTQLMDAASREWSREMLDALGIPAEVMPEIVEPGTAVGKLLKPIADMVGLNQAQLTAVGSHDTASAFAAAPVENVDEALIISSGTWSLVGKLVPEPITNEEAMKCGLSNEGGIGNVRLLKNCMGTWLVQELIRNWAVKDGRETGWDVLNRETVEAPAFTAFLNVDDSSFYNPSSMEDAIVEFCKKTGQKVPVTRGTFLRVVYESLALKYRIIKEELRKVTGKDSKVVNIVGGGTKNTMLNQYTADALGIPVKAGPEEGTAVGNFMVQALGLGLISKIEEALPIIRNSFPIKEYEPEDTAAWDQAYARYQKIVEG